jgi:hypothetical protein
MVKSRRTRLTLEQHGHPWWRHAKRVECGIVIDAPFGVLELAVLVKEGMLAALSLIRWRWLVGTGIDQFLLIGVCRDIVLLGLVDSWELLAKRRELGLALVIELPSSF